MNPTHQNFHTTRWTIVLQARGDQPEARAALSDLCEAYFNPVLRFLLREGKGKDEADELTQAFFARILSSNGIRNVDPAKGRFRSYLLGALKNFLSDLRRREASQKRGGEATHESLDETGPESSKELQIADSSAAIPDAYFDHEWALAVMDRGLQVVESSFARRDKSHHFELLKTWLMGDEGTVSQEEAAAELNLTPGAVKVAIHRMRKDFGEAIRSEIAQTVDSPEEVADELRYLIEALSSARSSGP